MSSLVALLLAACTESPPEPAAVAPDAVNERAAELAETTPAAASTEAADAMAEPVEIVLVWQGIGNLHRTYFSDASAVEALGRGLAGSVGGPANIYVRHDSENYVGQVRLQLRPGTRRAEVASSGDMVRLQDLAPITTALATYRSTIAANFDFRVESFHVGIEAFRGTHSCIFGVAGTPPPDGRVVSPCVEVDGAEVCGDPREDGVYFDSKVARTIRKCLDL